MRKALGKLDVGRAEGIFALGNSQMATQQLLVRQMARDLERFDQKKGADFTYYAYRGLSTLAGADWRHAPPDPTQETVR